MPPASCVAFEDSLSGVKSAAKAGMYVIAVPDKTLVSDMSEFEKEASIILNDLTEWNFESSLT